MRFFTDMMNSTFTDDRTRAFIDLSAIKHNYEVIRKTFPDVKVMSVLKADAYGHGISGIAATCDPLTDAFAVATVEEGERIRNAGAVKPVLVLGPVPEGKIRKAAGLKLTFSVGSLEYAFLIRKVLSENSLSAECHIKVDTGFNRTGFRLRAPAGDMSESMLSLQKMLQVFCMPELRVTGTYTHLPVPESDFYEDVEFTSAQLESFRLAVSKIREAGFDPGICHVYSTGGALCARGPLFDMVRVGMMVYGQCDSMEHYRELSLRQAMRWSANLIGISEIGEGETVGYGRAFTALRPTTLGIVSCGYADGYRRNYAGLSVLCGGKRVPIVGRICMDFFMVDLTEVEDAYIGMEVVLLGSDGVDEITAIEIADKRDSTCGEVTAAISPRVERYYE